MDMFFMGLIYYVVIQKKELNITDVEDYKRRIQLKIDGYKNDKYHSKNPAALKYLKMRMEGSINFYRRYL